MKTSARLVLLLCVVFAVAFLTASVGADRVGTCIRNCAQCKKMFGPYFDGLLCADTCVKYKGKIIPDAEDPETIEIYLRRVNKTQPAHDYRYTGNYVNQEFYQE